jgi:hypothetical protein
MRGSVGGRRGRETKEEGVFVNSEGDDLAECAPPSKLQLQLQQKRTTIGLYTLP